MPLSWIKMWLEALDDLKLTRLSLSERGAWWGILKLAGKCDAGGKIVSGGEGLSIDEVADALHIKTAEDRQSLESMIAKMKERGSLIWNGNALTVVHYEERQRIPPSARPEAVAERVRRHRERRKKTGNGEAVVDTEKIISSLSQLSGWQADEDDVLWLQGLRSECPGFTLAEFRACVDYYSGKAIPKHKGIWKNRFRNWMLKKIQFERGRSKGEGRGRLPTAEELEKGWKE